MTTAYLAVKFLHVLVAILAVGSSAASSLWLRVAEHSPQHYPFVLRTVKLLDERLTRPGLIVLLITGVWMAATRWSLSLVWVRIAIGLVLLVLALLYGVVGPLIQRMIPIAERDGLASPRWKRVELIFELVGGSAGILIIVVVWLMVTKPS